MEFAKRHTGRIRDWLPSTKSTRCVVVLIHASLVGESVVAMGLMYGLHPKLVQVRVHPENATMKKLSLRQTTSVKMVGEDSVLRLS